MRRMWFILLLLVLPGTVRSQADSVCCAPLRPHTAPLLGASLLSGSMLVSLQPELHQWEGLMYDRLGLEDVRQRSFDNVLQFLPMATPLVLKAAGLKSQHNAGQMALLGGLSFLMGEAVIQMGKSLCQVPRPDGTDLKSFPSGHTFIAFMGAEMIRREFGRDYPWLVYVGYGVAALVGAMRVYNSRHWPSDVLGGAGVALLSVSASYWLFEK